MKKIEHKDRRRAPRTALNSALIDYFSGQVPGQSKLRGRICDISRVGIKFRSVKPYAEDSRINLNLLLPNAVPFTDISGRVVRCEAEDNNFYQTAVEFEESCLYLSLIEDYATTMKSWENIFN